MSNGVKDYTNTGALWRNQYKTEDKHPGTKGNAQIKCPHCQMTQTYDLAGWKKKPDASEKAPELSLRFSLPQPKGESRPVAVATNDDFEDMVPF